MCIRDRSWTLHLTMTSGVDGVSFGCPSQAWLRAVPCLAGSHLLHKLRTMLCHVIDILERVAPCHVICAPCYCCSVSCRVILFVFLSVSCRALSLLLQIRAMPCLARRGPTVKAPTWSILGERVWELRVIPCHASFRVFPCRVVLL